MKQERLLAALRPDRERGLMPCFACRRFLRVEMMDMSVNGGVLFFEGRGFAMCIGCRTGIDPPVYHP